MSIAIRFIKPKLCACGCGQEPRKKSSKYLPGHWIRINPLFTAKGKTWEEIHGKEKTIILKKKLSLELIGLLTSKI